MKIINFFCTSFGLRFLMHIQNSMKVTFLPFHGHGDIQPVIKVLHFQHKVRTKQFSYGILDMYCGNKTSRDYLAFLERYNFSSLGNKTIKQ